MSSPRTILVLTRHTPLPWEDGAGAYVFDILAHLRDRGFRIHVAWLAPHDHLRWRGVWTLPADFARVARLHLPGALRLGRRQIFPSVYWLPFKARALHAIKRALTTLGLRVGHGRPAGNTAHRPPPTGWMAEPSAAERAFAATMIARLRPSAIIVNYAWLTPLFETIPADLSCRRVCIQSDVAWHRAAQQAELAGRIPEFTAATEARLLHPAATVVTISEADARELAALAPHADVVFAPKSVRPAPLPLARAPRLLFVGSGNGFNAAGLAWFLAEVWPLVRAARPEAELDVCGTVANAVRTRPAGVQFHGPVEDLDVHYRAAALVVVPLLQATGLNIKLVDAAARGRAILTTSATLAGAPFLAGSVATADTPAEFAAATLRLLGDFAARAELAERSLAVVRAHLAPAACYGHLAAALS